MEIKINIRKKHFYLLSSLVILIGSIIFVQGQGASNFGHSASHIQITSLGKSVEQAVKDSDFKGASFGVWETKQNDQVYLAATDGFVLATGDKDYNIVRGYTDTSNPPTIKRSQNKWAYDGGPESIMMPVRKGDYWKVTSATVSVFWISVGN